MIERVGPLPGRKGKKEGRTQHVQHTMIVILPDRSSRDIGTGPCTAGEILARFSIGPQEAIVSVDGKVVPDDTVVCGECTVRIVRIAHGG